MLAKADQPVCGPFLLSPLRSLPFYASAFQALEQRSQPQPVATDPAAELSGLALMTSTVQFYAPGSNEKAVREILEKFEVSPDEIIAYTNEKGVNNGFFDLLYKDYEVRRLSLGPSNRMIQRLGIFIVNCIGLHWGFHLVICTTGFCFVSSLHNCLQSMCPCALEASGSSHKPWVCRPSLQKRFFFGRWFFVIAHSWPLIYCLKTAYADFSAIPLLILLLSVIKMRAVRYVKTKCISPFQVYLNTGSSTLLTSSLTFLQTNISAIKKMQSLGFTEFCPNQYYWTPERFPYITAIKLRMPTPQSGAAGTRVLQQQTGDMGAVIRHKIRGRRHGAQLEVFSVDTHMAVSRGGVTWPAEIPQVYTHTPVTLSAHSGKAFYDSVISLLQKLSRQILVFFFISLLFQWSILHANLLLTVRYCNCNHSHISWCHAFLVLQTIRIRFQN
jgi:hypothetical protein